MKYSRLSKEQFEALHEEFSQFLASQSIDKEAWEVLKKEKSNSVDGLLDIFSDITWDKVLDKATYLENLSPQTLFLFKLMEQEMRVLVIKTKSPLNLITKESLQWLQEHFTSDEVELLTASKGYSANRKMDIFQLIQQGAVITKGEFFENVATFLEK